MQDGPEGEEKPRAVYGFTFLSISFPLGAEKGLVGWEEIKPKYSLTQNTDFEWCSSHIQASPVQIPRE